jgi:Skp family chaperone for outer membrane proteins
MVCIGGSHGRMNTVIQNTAQIAGISLALEKAQVVLNERL